MGGKSSRNVLIIGLCVFFSALLLAQEDDLISQRHRSRKFLEHNARLGMDRAPEELSQIANGQYPIRIVDDFAVQPLDPETWQSFGPMGGNVISLKVSPADPDKIHALVYCNYWLSCLYKSTNGGKNWTKTAAVSRGCYDMAIHPHDPQILYVLAAHFVLKSTDDGATWSQHSLGSNSLAYNGQIVIDPENPDVLHACGYHYFSSSNYCMASFKSTDGGVNWSAQYIQQDSVSGRAYCLAVNPSSPNVLYLGGYYKEGYYTRYRLYKSTDSAESWQDATGAIGGIPYSVIVDPTDTSKVYVGTPWGVYRSADSAQTWAKDEGSVSAYALGMDPAIPNTIYAGYNDRCYKSTDGGVSWAGYTAGLNGTCQDILAYSGMVFYGSYVGLHKSVDGGITWKTSHNGIKNNVIPAVAVARSSPNVIYAEGAQNGLFKSTDFGSSWTRLPDFYRCESIYAIAVNSADPDELVLLAGG